MSWNGNITVKMNEDVSKQIDQYLESNPSLREHGGPQVDVAKDAVLGLLTDVARPQDDVRISFSGHYNPDNEPRAGWADNFISINIYQIINKG